VKIGRYLVPRLIGWLVGIAAVLTVGITAFVYSGDQHREAVTAIARGFFVLVEKASRSKTPLVNASPTPTQEGGTIR
jgi:hypothetical protein